MLVAIRFTACVKTGEMLPVKFPLPGYTAVIECEPAASAEVVKVAWPLFNKWVPRVVPPSLKVTLPAGTPVPEDGETVAVNVTDCPRVEGF